MGRKGERKGKEGTGRGRNGQEGEGRGNERLKGRGRKGGRKGVSWNLSEWWELILFKKKI